MKLTATALDTRFLTASWAVAALVKASLLSTSRNKSSESVETVITERRTKMKKMIGGEEEE